MRTMYDETESFGSYRQPPGQSGRFGRLGGRLGRAGRWRNQLIGAVALVAAWLTMTALGPGRGLLVIGLVWLLCRSLAAHHADGGGREWLRALAEYAVVAALTVAVMTVLPAPAPPKAESKPAAAERTQATDPWAKLRARFDRLVDRVSAGAPEIKFTDAEKP